MTHSIGSAQLGRLLGGWSSGDGALHAQLAAALRSLVVSGRLPTGARLPSERALSSALNLSRNTVGTAFDALRAEGLFTSRHGAGTFVSSEPGSSRARGDDRLHSFVAAPASAATVDLRSAALPGIPLVTDAIESLSAAAFDMLVSSHGYVPLGLPVLRSAIAAYYDQLGLPTQPDQILVTTGAQQALRLAAGALLRPGATVLIEEPSFRGAIESLRSLGARLIPVPRKELAATESDEPIARMAERLAQHRPSLLFAQSTVHNPTGEVLTEPARLRLTQLADALRIPVIDDTALADTVMDGPQPPPLARRSERVVTIGSVSKSFWGGIRVGWLRTDPDTVNSLASLKGGEDLGTSLLAQVLAAELLPRITEARDSRARTLGDARSRVLERMDALLPDWEPTFPLGGASLWIRLPSMSATAFTQLADRNGVRLLPGPTFSSIDRLDDHLRLSFSGDPQVTLNALDVLAHLWNTRGGNTKR